MSVSETLSGLRPIARQPIFPTHCPTCNYVLAVEVRRGGELTAYCAGCQRNKERARMHLPPITYFVAHKPQPPRPSSVRTRKSPLRVRKEAFRAALLRKTPRYEHTAATTRELANACGVCKQKALVALYQLRAEGRVEVIDCQMLGGRGLKWYRLMQHEPKTPAGEAA